MSEHPSSQKVSANLWTAISSAVGRLLTETKRALSIARHATVTGIDAVIRAVQFARLLQRASGLLDDASLPRKGDPHDWLERSLAEDEAARRSARSRRRLRDERTLSSADLAAKDVAMRRAVSEVDFPG